MTLEERRYEALEHTYSVNYPRTMWMFPNQSHFKFWNWLFTHYMYRLGTKKSNPEIIDIPRTFLQKYLGLSRGTIQTTIDYMTDIEVLSKVSGSTAYRFNTGYVAGVIAMLNDTEMADIPKFIQHFINGEKERLYGIGLVDLPRFVAPSVQTLNNYSSDDDGRNEVVAQNLGNGKCGAQNLGNTDGSPNIRLVSILISNDCLKNGQVLEGKGESCPKFGHFSKGDNNNSLNIGQSVDDAQILAQLLSKFGHSWSGEVKFTIKDGKLEEISTEGSKPSDKSSLKFGQDMPNIWAEVAQNLAHDAQNLAPLYNPIYNPYEKYYPKFENKLESIQEQLNVLLEKNQNNGVEPAGSLSSQGNGNLGLGERHDNTQPIEKEMWFDKYGKTFFYTPDELQNEIQKKINDPHVKNFLRTLESVFEEGVQITKSQLLDQIELVAKEALPQSARCPVSGELVPIDSLDPEYITKGFDLPEDEREERLELLELLELYRFCKKDYKLYLQHCKFHGVAVFVHWKPCDVVSLEDRKEEFRLLHLSHASSADEELAKMSEMDRYFKLVEMFEEQFPEGREFPFQDMLDAMRLNMIRLNLFSILEYEYNAYNIFDAFHGAIKVIASNEQQIGTRYIVKTQEEISEEGVRERTKIKLDAFERSLNAARSSTLNYGEKLLGWKPPRCKIIEGQNLPAKPILESAFLYLGFQSGQLLENSDLDDICNTVLAKHAKSGYGAASFRGSDYYIRYIDSSLKCKLINLPEIEEAVAENVAENEPEEEYIPRPRPRRDRRR